MGGSPPPPVLGKTHRVMGLFVCPVCAVLSVCLSTCLLMGTRLLWDFSEVV